MTPEESARALKCLRKLDADVTEWDRELQKIRKAPTAAQFADVQSGALDIADSLRIFVADMTKVFERSEPELSPPETQMTPTLPITPPKRFDGSPDLKSMILVAVVMAFIAGLGAGITIRSLLD